MIVQNITNVIPINDKVMYIQLDHTTPIMGQQLRGQRKKKEKFMKICFKIASKFRNKGPVLIGGDFNARLQHATDDDEKSIIGNHTFHRQTADITHMPADMLEKRNLLVSLCREHDMLAINTHIRKPENKLATFRKVGADRTATPTRNDHEQIDCWLIGARWKNMIKDAETDMKAKIDSDHSPLTIISRFALKRKTQNHASSPKPRYQKCTEMDTRSINHFFRETIQSQTLTGT